MRIPTMFALVVVGGGLASAEDAPPAPQPEPAPSETEKPPAAPETPPAPPAPAPIVTGPVTSPNQLPPINITITNNNNGNNSNTNTQTNSQTNDQKNDQKNDQHNDQTNTQTSTQTNQQDVALPPGLSPPIAAPPTATAIARYELLPPIVRPLRWITLGVVAGEHQHGIRGSVDLLVRRKWSLGVAATVSGDGAGHHRGGEGHGHGAPSGAAVAYLAYTTKLGPFDVRAQLGFGGSSAKRESSEAASDQPTIARTVTGGDPQVDQRRGHGDWAPHAEAAILVGLPLTKHLSVFAGPVLSSDAETGERDNGADGDRDGRRGHGHVEPSFVGGLTFRF